MGFLKKIGKFFKSVLKFEKANLKHMVGLVKKDPERLLIGAADPFSSKLWGKILGKDYDPIVNQWGGPSEGAFQYAESKGIDTGPAAGLHTAAKMVAAFYAGQYGVSKMNFGGAAANANAATPDISGAATGVTTGPNVPAGATSGVNAVAGATPTSTVAPASRIGGLFRGASKGLGKAIGGITDFTKSNPEITGSVISGLGQGLLSNSAVDAEREILRERYGHYANTDPGRTYKSLASPASSSSSMYRGYEYQYDPSVGRIVKVELGG